MTRRAFIGSTVAGAAIAAVPGFAQSASNVIAGEESTPPVPRKDQPQIRVLLREFDLSPLDSERSRTLTARDLANDPLPQPVSSAEGRSRIALDSEPIQIAVRLKVPDFGEVYCFADNHGKGYTHPGNIEFVVDAAATRLRRVRESVERQKAIGLPNDPELDRDLQAAAELLSTTKTGPQQTPAAYNSLGKSLRAGERLTLNAAKYRISKLAAPRKDFLFGGLAAGFQRGVEFERPFTELFNYATASWYIWNQTPDPPETRIDYSRMDKSIDWCLSHKLVPKNFGYVYLTNGATPEWFRSWPFEKVLPEYKRIVRQTAARYDGRVPFMEVINEAHDKANNFHFSHEQILELTREACRAARDGSSTVKRLINHCCLWAEYGKRANAGGQRRWSPYRYLKDCVRAGVEFECIGLQLYYPQYDLFEIDAMLNRFKDFGKRLQISELSCNSADGLDAASMRPMSRVPGWHAPWSESMQADWLESIYTICYSKPEFEAVGYWDLADVGGHFWPHGGLLQKDFTPKKSFHRLSKLKKSWGLAPQ